MNSKELVLSAIRNESTERAPWVPFVGCHAAKLIGVTADKYFMDADLIVQGMQKAAELYRADGVPALFDLQVEAEAMGCKLKWAPNNPPSVASHPLAEGKALSDIGVPTEKDGRFPIVLDAMRRLCQTVGRDKAVYGLVTGPFTLALHLLGSDIFYAMIDDPEETHRLLKFCEKVCIETSRMYLDAGVDVIAIVDPMTSQISPASFEEFVSPRCTSIYRYVQGRGKPATLFVCGDARKNIEAMAKSGPDGLSIDENIPLDYVRDVCARHGISFGGNIKLTVTMLFGTVADNVNDAMNCLAIGGTKGYLLSPGCDMPFDVPEENAMAIAAVAHGETVKFMEGADSLDGVDPGLPDYADKSNVYVDVVTLDSASCAPCQYMMEAVRTSSQGLCNLVIQEHKVKEKEAVAAMMKLGVTNIPTICVDGEIKFVSVIPDGGTLRDTLTGALEKKGLK